MGDATGRVFCAYEDRPEAMDGLILTAESLCRADPEISLHLTVPHAPDSVLGWARSRRGVRLVTTAPEGLGGWDVKPGLLLQELDAGNREAVWIDADMIVTRPVSPWFEQFPRESLIVAEEWNRPGPVNVTRLWNMPSGREVVPVNSCFIRATQAHRTLLERWRGMTRSPRYRAAQAVPFAQRPWYLNSDQPLLTALLGTEEFAPIEVSYVRMGPHIAQCAGASGYRPQDRVLDLFRGLPALFHCIGRKPWTISPEETSGTQQFLSNLATDVSPYVLAARRVAMDLGMSPGWLKPRTSTGAALRGLFGGHPGLTGLPLAVLHTLVMKNRDGLTFSQGEVKEIEAQVPNL